MPPQDSPRAPGPRLMAPGQQRFAQPIEAVMFQGQLMPGFIPVRPPIRHAMGCHSSCVYHSALKSFDNPIFLCQSALGLPLQV